MPASKPATAVSATTALIVDDGGERSWVSRGAHKLIGALDGFGLSVSGRRCLDAGASTGGFTEVLLDRGAREVVAVDVGYGQLAWSLRSDDRVRVVERTNVRDLTAEAIGGFRPGAARRGGTGSRQAGAGTELAHCRGDRESAARPFGQRRILSVAAGRRRRTPR